MVALALLLAAAPQSQDLVLHNGRVYTLDPAAPWAEAVVTSGERIAFVGKSADARKRAPAGARVIDLKGAFVVPGFHDGHVHIDETGELLLGVNLLDVHEPKAFAERIGAATKRMPKGAWITGTWGAYEDDAAKQGPPFAPTREMIDAVTPEHPVLVNRFDDSAFLANAKALELSGVKSPTGLVSGKDLEKVRAAIPESPLELKLLQLQAVLDEARAGGVTSIQDGVTSREWLRAYREAERRGMLTTRLLARPSLDLAPMAKELGLSQGFGSSSLKIVGFKAWVDGIMGNSSALFFEPYESQGANRGKLRKIMFPEGREGWGMSMKREQRYTDAPPGNLEKLMLAAAEAGIPAHVHAIGDEGNRILLDVLERVLPQAKLLGTDHRWRVIHAQVMDPPDIARLGKLGLVAEVNPYHVTDDMRWMENKIGKRCTGAYAFRSLKEAGAPLVFGSDSPGTMAARYYLSPVYGLYAAVTRQTLGGEPKEGWYPAQRLTIEEALDAYIRAPAWAAFEEHDKGTLTAGKLADLAVFDKNLVDVAKKNLRELLDAKVLVTVTGGRVVYERSGK